MSNKSISRILVITLAVIFSLTLTSVSVFAASKATKVKITTKSQTIYMHKNLTLKAEITPKKYIKTAKWKIVKNPFDFTNIEFNMEVNKKTGALKIRPIKGADFKKLKKGSKIKVVVKAGGKTSKPITLTIKHPSFTKINLPRKNAEIWEGTYGGTEKVTFAPLGANEGLLTVSSSDNSIAKVEWESDRTMFNVGMRNAYIFGKKPGKAVITVKSPNGQKATCNVTVKKLGLVEYTGYEYIMSKPASGKANGHAKFYVTATKTGPVQFGIYHPNGDWNNLEYKYWANVENGKKYYLYCTLSEPFLADDFSFVYGFTYLNVKHIYPENWRAATMSNFSLVEVVE